jgi:hypothetical protein
MPGLYPQISENQNSLLNDLYLSNSVLAYHLVGIKCHAFILVNKIVTSNKSEKI